MNNLKHLIERVAGATGPDREIDRLIALWQFPYLSELPRADHGGWHSVDYGLIAPAEPYTSSVDAALGLVERALPTYTVDLTVYRTNDGEFAPSSCARLFCPYGEITEYRAKAPSPALALVLSMLRGLEDRASSADFAAAGATRCAATVAQKKSEGGAA